MEKGLFDVKKVLKCVLLTFVMTVLLGGLLAAAVTLWDVDETVARIAVFAIMILSVVFGAFVLAKNLERNGLLNGLLMALIYFLVIMAASFIINGKKSIGIPDITRLVTVAASGMLGGILGINS